MDDKMTVQWTNPDGSSEGVQVTKEQLLRMLKAAKNDQPVAPSQPAPQPQPQYMAPRPSMDELQMRAAMMQQQQMQMLHCCNAGNLTEIQKCQMDPDRMKMWAIGLPLGGAVVGGLLTAFAINVFGNND